MPNESLSVYLTAVDGMSPVLASVTDKTKALDKESQELQQTYEALQKANKELIAQKTKLQGELRKANEEVKAANKSFKELNDEASSDALNKATEKQQALKDQITATTKALQENRKTYKENIETIRKGAVENADSALNIGQILGGLGIGQQLSSLAQQAGGALLSSAFGSDMGGLASGALSSAISGAALGSAIAPGIGTAIGAALGGLSGLAGGAVEQWANQDEAFKSYYGGLYDDVSGRAEEMVGSGASLASARETNRISFTTLFDGDEDRARNYLENLVEMANITPFLYDDLVSMSKTLATYGYDDSNILPLLQTIGDAGAALSMSTGDMTSVAQALGRMKSSDKATLEYLNILNDRGIGAVGMLADAKGVSQGDMYSMISKGEISGTEAVSIITEALKEAYSGSMATQSQTFAGISSTLEGLQQNLDALGGEAYNTLRQGGMEAEKNALGGELGDAIGEINAIMGENQARKENLQEQYLREAKEAVLLGKEGSVFSEEEQAALAGLSAQYAEAKARYEESGRTDAEAAAKMESLYEQGQTLAQAYFDNSDFMQMLTDVEMDEIQAIIDNTAGLNNLNKVIYDLPQRLTVGRAGTTEAKEQANYVFNSLAAGSMLMNGDTEGAMSLMAGSSHAYGLTRVPRDDYPALLHEGERVLTASEARAQDAARATPVPIQLTITGNSFTGTPEEMADQLAEIIVRKLEQAVIAAAPK